MGVSIAWQAAASLVAYAAINGAAMGLGAVWRRHETV